MSEPAVVLVSRVPWPHVEAVLEAFGEARRDRSKSPLTPFFRSSALDGVEIVRKKKYGFFGEVRTTFAQASTFVVAAIEQKSQEAIDLGDAPTRSKPAALLALFAHDRGLPDWMHGDGGPSLIAPKELAELRALLAGDSGWTDDEKRPLLDLLGRCTPNDGLMIEL